MQRVSLALNGHRFALSRRDRDDDYDAYMACIEELLRQRLVVSKPTVAEHELRWEYTAWARPRQRVLQQLHGNLELEHYCESRRSESPLDWHVHTSGFRLNAPATSIFSRILDVLNFPRWSRARRCDGQEPDVVMVKFEARRNAD